MENNIIVDNSNPLPELEQKHPWLVMNHINEVQRQTFYSISKAQYFENLIPEMRNKQVSQASYGWLLLIDNDTLDCCLMNPKSMEKVHLPQVVRGGSYRCVLSKPPTEPNCRILIIVNSWWILFSTVGDDEFSKRSALIGGGFAMTPINFQGKIYAWMRESRGFVTVDFENEDLILENLVNKDGQECLIPRLTYSPSYAPIKEDFLIESCGKLLLVHVIRCIQNLEQVAGFRIFQIDVAKMEWEELGTIGDRAIFYSDNGSMTIACSSKEVGVEKDSIYYVNSLNLLYIYHIPYEMEESIVLCPELKRGDISFTTWIMI